MLARAVSTARGDLENVEGGRRAFRELASRLDAVDAGALRQAAPSAWDPRERIARIRRDIAAARKVFEGLWALARRTPPEGAVDLLKEGKALWALEGSGTWALSKGALTVRAPKGPVRLTSLHYFWKDFTARMTFRIQGGRFDLSLRALPGSLSPFTMNIDQGRKPHAFTVLIEVRGKTVKFMTPDGTVIDAFRSDTVVPGGGIAFRIMPGAILDILVLKVEAQ
jgi:hypothetical protein